MTLLLSPKSSSVALVPVQESTKFACEQVSSSFKYRFQCFDEADELIAVLAS